MYEPSDGQPVAQDQIDEAVNKDSYSDAVPGAKGWHKGDCPGWFLEDPIKWGYDKDDQILYGEVISGGQSIHIYWIPSKAKTVIVPMYGSPPPM